MLERIASQRRFAPNTLEIAKGLFIERHTPRRLAVEHGVNVQRVYAIRDQFLAAAQALALPPGWEEVTLAGPRELIEELRRLHAEGLKRLEQAGGSR
jgi:hypothetical protein